MTDKSRGEVSRCQKMKKVIRWYAKAAFSLLIIFAIAYIAARFRIRMAPVLYGGRARTVYSLIALGCFFVSGIGRIGWEIQTWNGNTPPERLDKRLYLGALCSGTFFLAFQLILDIN